MAKRKSETVKAMERVLGEKLSSSGRKRYPQTVERLNAVRAVYNDLLIGSTYTICHTKLMEDGYNIGRTYCHSAADQIIQDAKSLIKIDFENDREYAREKLYTYLSDVYTECRENGDRYVAVKAVAEMAKLIGLYDNNKPQLRIEADGGVTIKFGFGNDEEENKNETDIQEAEIVE